MMMVWKRDGVEGCESSSRGGEMTPCADEGGSS